MTENEATRELKSIKSFMKNHGRTTGCDFLESEYEALNMAIQALEEIQKYKVIQKMIGIPLEDFAKLCVEKVPEECKNPKKAIILTDEDVDKWEAYKAIGTVEESKALKEKSVAKKPYIQQSERGDCFECPNCDSFIGYVVDCQDEHYQDNYCPYCSQKLDWQ